MKWQWKQLGPLAIALSWFVHADPSQAELIGYWSADSTGGMGRHVVNDQGASELTGTILGGASFTGLGQGPTTRPGDHAVSFPGQEEDFVSLPPTDLTYEEMTLTAWVRGFPTTGPLAGLVMSRDETQPIGLRYRGPDRELGYIWNNDSAETREFASGLTIPDAKWTFVALTVEADAATLWVGPIRETLQSTANQVAHVPQTNGHEWRLAQDDCCDDGRVFAGLMDDVAIWDEALTEDDLSRLHRQVATPLDLFGPPVFGDFNDDQRLDAADIDLLAAEVRSGTNDPFFDVTGDGLTNSTDHSFWVTDIRRTWFGDANMDGQFNTGDLVEVFQSGEYEDGIALNSNWAEGDWNGNGDFDSGDLVVAFEDGGFEGGFRTQPAVAAVPEPSSGTLLLVVSGLSGIVWRRRSSTQISSAAH